MKNILGILASVIILSLIAYGSWRMNRWWNYKLSYQSLVQEEMQPLTKQVQTLTVQVSNLMWRVSVMETNR